jgi:methylated-DNA-protein-cysteine methyltransferase-like protein
MIENKTGFFKQVYEVVKQIPMGKVATYGQIALILGRPRSSKFVGFALNKNPYPIEVPCHRIVNRFGFLAGSFAFGGIDAQRKLLEAEKVFVDENNCVDLSVFQWKQNLAIDEKF